MNNPNPPPFRRIIETDYYAYLGKMFPMSSWVLTYCLYFQRQISRWCCTSLRSIQSWRFRSCSDGDTDEVADLVLANPNPLPDLLEGLYLEGDLVRARTAHAIERVTRSKPELLSERFPELAQMAVNDRLPTLRRHIAMTLANPSVVKKLAGPITAALFEMFADKSVFVKSWAISSLCIIGRQFPHKRKVILTSLARLQNNPSPAIRTRARKAIQLLTNDHLPIPDGWVKSKHLKNI